MLAIGWNNGTIQCVEYNHQLRHAGFFAISSSLFVEVFYRSFQSGSALIMHQYVLRLCQIPEVIRFNVETMLRLESQLICHNNFDGLQR